MNGARLGGGKYFSVIAMIRAIHIESLGMRDNKMKLTTISLLVLMTSSTTDARGYDSTPFPGGENAAIVIDGALPASDMLPEQSVAVPASDFVMLQSKGGSLLLGPILSSLNVRATTKKLAQQSSGQYLSTDIAALAVQSLQRIGIGMGPKEGAYILRPFAFIQECDDGNFRVALAYHVEGPEKKNHWVGRYTYHLPTPIPIAGFSDPSLEQVAHFVGEIATGVQILTELLERDRRGDLPGTGKKVKFGSLNLIGNKVGGLGIYTPPEKRFFPAVLIEDTDQYVTVRIATNPHSPALFGGQAFGVQRMDRKLVHTLTE
ncbi:MAG TPA: hypothetical protein VGL87_15290 [Steroidobacteraceae bacterium]